MNKKNKYFLLLVNLCLIVQMLSNKTIANATTIENSIASINSTYKIHQNDSTGDNNRALLEEGIDSEQCNVDASIAPFFVITIPKDITMSGITKTAIYDVNVKGDIAGDQQISVIPDSTFILSERGGKADITVDGIRLGSIKEGGELDKASEIDSRIIGWCAKKSCKLESLIERCEIISNIK